MRIDLHTHSNISDGTDTPAALVSAAAEAGLDAVALCDHDTMLGVPEAQAAGQVFGVAVLRGLEMSAELGGVTIHLLGYGCDPVAEPLAAALSEVRQGRDERVPRMVAALNAAGLPLTVEDVLAQATPGTTLGRPHVADAMIAQGLVSDRQEAFMLWLGEGCPGYVSHPRIPIEQGIAMIRGAGGVTVLAHAWGRGSRRVLTPRVIAQLAEFDGLDGLEVDHRDHDGPTRAALRTLAEANDLLVTGSSDYHGTGKIDHDLGCETTTQANYEAIIALIKDRSGRL